MILAWNVQGLNKATRHEEIRSHLRQLDCACVTLLETRVKIGNTDIIHRGLGFSTDWARVDNHEKHETMGGYG